MNHYPRHVGDYIRDTVGLSMLEEGAYTRLLDQYYVTEMPLPLDSARLYRMARATSKAERTAVDVVLAQFFTRTIDGYRQKRADEELEGIYKRSESARDSARERWNKRNANADANAMRTHSDGNADSMLPITPTPNTHNPTPSSATHPSPSASDAPPSTPLTRGEKTRPDVEPKTGRAWEAYRSAFMDRYGVEPPRNAKQNSLLAQLVDRIGADEAPAVAAFYLLSNRQAFVLATHSLNLLVQHAEGIRTAWATNRHGTESEARMVDKTAARGNVYEAVRQELKNAPR